MSNPLQNEENTFKKFYCDLCFFKADKQKDYTRHLDTLKHIKNKEIEEQNQKDKKEREEQNKKKQQEENDKKKEEQRKAFAERRRLSLIENDKLQEEIISKSALF